MVQFEGTYLHDKDDNFEALLASIGVGFIIRKLASRAKPTIRVTIEENSWIIVTTLPIKTMTWKFKLNEETEVEAPEGKLKVIFNLDGNTLTQKPTGESSEKDVVVVREFTDEGMKQTMTHISSGTVGSRFFKRFKEE